VFEQPYERGSNAQEGFKVTTAEQSFEEAVAEFLEKSRELIDQEAVENLPPWEPAPYDQSGPPYEYSQRFTVELLSRYALTTGDNNSLFTEPGYGKGTRYSNQLPPGPILALLRYSYQYLIWQIRLMYPTRPSTETGTKLNTTVSVI
jgi:hypothetical protein